MSCTDSGRDGRIMLDSYETANSAKLHFVCSSLVLRHLENFSDYAGSMGPGRPKRRARVVSAIAAIRTRRLCWRAHEAERRKEPQEERTSARNQDKILQWGFRV